MSIYEQLRPIFYPKSVALAGITVANPSHWTRTLFNALIDTDFQGQLYLVNPRGGEIEGHKVYHSLAEIPGEVEYVISTVAASAAPGLMKECTKKGVKAVHFCTSGFAETGEEEGIRLEAEVAKLAREARIRVIGPNCMGIYCPESRLAFYTGFCKESGHVGFISQSGGNTAHLVRHAAWRGVRFSKVISFGNACDLNEADFLEYLTEDRKTKIIALYLEGVKEGKRFLRALEQATRKKTVILLKGGVTQGGAQATLGHTGALAGEETTWDAVCKQYGVIQVTTLEELTDVLVTLLFFPLPKGRNAILLGAGGGASVIITDQFEKNGLRVPPLPQDIKDQICAFTPIAGNILRNPIDYGQNIMDIDKLRETVDIVMRWKGSDFLVAFSGAGLFPPEVEPLLPQMIEELHKATTVSSKPTAVILEPSIIPDMAAIILPAIQKIVATGAPVYYSFEGAAKSIDLVLKHYHI
jgi:acyl-CoA synthetase (NDP forming)